VDGFGSNNFIKVIMVPLMKGGRLTRGDVIKNLCFGANGASIFQGSKIKVTKQIKEAWARLSMGVHCVVHRTNLAIRFLSDLTFIACI